MNARFFLMCTFFYSKLSSAIAFDDEKGPDWPGIIEGTGDAIDGAIEDIMDLPNLFELPPQSPPTNAPTAKPEPELPSSNQRNPLFFSPNTQPPVDSDLKTTQPPVTSDDCDPKKSPGCQVTTSYIVYPLNCAENEAITKVLIDASSHTRFL